MAKKSRERAAERATEAAESEPVSRHNQRQKTAHRAGRAAHPSMASAQVDLPAVRPEALWALAIAVGWLVAQRERPASRRSCVRFSSPAAAAWSAQWHPVDAKLCRSSEQCNRLLAACTGGQRFAEVVKELGLPKLRAALTSDIFARLQAQILEKFPPPSGLAEAPLRRARWPRGFGAAVPSRSAVGFRFERPAKTQQRRRRSLPSAKSPSRICGSTTKRMSSEKSCNHPSRLGKSWKG